MGNIRKPIMDLKEFMVRKQVLSLYRDILKAIKEVPSQEDQKVLLEWVRHDFKINKHHKDQDCIRSLITYGQRSLKELKQSLDLAK